MKQFFKYVFASTLGFFIAYIVIFIGSIAFMINLASNFEHRAKGDKNVKIKSETILQMSLNKPIVERNDDNPFLDFSFLDDEDIFPLSLKDIIDNIAKAKDDDDIQGIFLNLSVVPATFATLEEIRNALIDFKSSDKFIYAYSSIMTEDAYYLASVADKIYMEPEGMFIFDGFKSEVMYIKGALEKLEIEPVLIKVGQYKAAGETFVRKDMSDANRKQLEEFLNPLWNAWISNMATARGMTKEEINSVAENYKIRTVTDAVALKMIDGERYYDQVLDELKEKTGTEELNFIGLNKYNRVQKKSDKEFTKDRIAIVYATGNINMGKGSQQAIGSESLSKALRKARNDDHVKAIVLRINSPGGASLASDIIWREVKLAADAKPLVVSMGDYAASGGYYIAAPADTIVAQPTTLTGSIGVFGLFANFEKFYNNKLGITFDRVKTNKYADFMNPNRAMLPEEEAIVQGFINDTYEEFVGKVAEGRGLDTAFVKSIAQGHIWSGAQAKELGLVDVLGGFDDAIDIAAKMAGIENYRLSILPEFKNPFDAIFGGSKSKIQEHILKKNLGSEYTIYSRIKEIREMNGVYMMMPFSFTVK